ncbi:MAG: DUF488 domain-containing protein [Chloroflexi bacterium]|nr:DUF488 domain-containing protein [Chloroflexota bacterium]
MDAAPARRSAVPTTLYTIGFTKSSAAHFFGRLVSAGVKQLVDIRLHNTSTLAGFSKRDDLAYFLSLHGIGYHHELRLAPEPDLLKAAQSGAIPWDAYEAGYLSLIEERDVAATLDRAMFAGPTALLCSEATTEHCHRRVAADHLRARWGDLEIVHL